MAADRLLQAEADLYRRALIALWGSATSGSRKTMDNAEVERVAGQAIDAGNELARRAKAVAMNQPSRFQGTGSMKRSPAFQTDLSPYKPEDVKKADDYLLLHWLRFGHCCQVEEECKHRNL